MIIDFGTREEIKGELLEDLQNREDSNIEYVLDLFKNFLYDAKKMEFDPLNAIGILPGKESTLLFVPDATMDDEDVHAHLCKCAKRLLNTMVLGDEDE
jgi:hypothetical protein